MYLCTQIRIVEMRRSSFCRLMQAEETLLSPRLMINKGFDRLKRPLARESQRSYFFVNALKWAMSHAACGAEGGESRSQDADDDLQEGLPSFFLHRGLRFEV